MKRIISVLALCSAMLLTMTAANAATTNLIVTPSSQGFDSNNVVGVPNDAAPGFPFGSFASNGIAKTDIYFTPEVLFGRSVALSEIASISYWTKKGTTHVLDPSDWFLAIYTKPYGGDLSAPTWYGDRIGSEPYFAINPSDPANTWNQWTTDDQNNQLRFFESTQGAPGANFGSYTDPIWADFVAGNALSGEAYGSRDLLFISVQTGSSWAAGFTGQLDGLRIDLTDGSVANINFEAANMVATDKETCKKSGWMALYRNDFTTFKNQGDCIQYVHTGK
jgi:hypothetical protein